MTNQISPIHTPCKQCSFAKYNDKTQTGCFLDYINIYKKNNTEILEAYDEDKEFFIINNKKCIGYREDKWFEKRGLLNSTIDEKIAKYQESNYAHYIAVINLKNLNIENLQNIYANLSLYDIKPEKIVLVRYIDNKNFPYSSIENIFENGGLNIQWRIQTMLDNDIPYQYILYDIAKTNKFSRFILSIEQHNLKINDVINYVNDKVYKQLKNFCVCGDKNKNVLFYSSTVLRHAYESGKDIVNDPDLCETI
jgi:hypothetical protein